MSVLTDKKIYDGRPNDERTQRERAVYELLSELDIAYKRIDHAPAATIEDCKEVDMLLETEMCKNLFLCNAGKTKFYLLLIPGDKKFVTKEASKKMNTSRLSFATAEYMGKYLGVSPGSVSVLGLMNDKKKNIELFIDEDLLKSEYIGCHPCVNTSSLKIKMSDILDKFLKHTGHGYTAVSL